MCTHTTRQVEHQRCSRTGRVQKNQKILRKNTIFNEHPVYLNCLILSLIFVKNHQSCSVKFSFKCIFIFLYLFIYGYLFIHMFIYPYIFSYRVFIKYCVFPLKCCDFSELCQFCCSAGFLPAWCVYTH